MTSGPTVQVSGVSKKFTIPTEVPRSLKEKVFKSLSRGQSKHTFHVLQNINFSISQGETFGIIGANGSGKSTLFKLLCGVISPTAGSIEIKGRISAVVELTAGFHDELTGRENIYLNGAIYGLSRAQVDSKISKICSFADIGQFMDARIRTYSSGMLARLAFALSINVDADVLMFDEVLAVGDIVFRKRCIEKINALRAQNKTVLYVSHDLEQVRSLCSRVMWLERGEIKMLGEAEKVLEAYASYSQNQSQPSQFSD